MTDTVDSFWLLFGEVKVVKTIVTKMIPHIAGFVGPNRRDNGTMIGDSMNSVSNRPNMSFIDIIMI